jgi:serine/threonine-protein kinase
MVMELPNINEKDVSNIIQGVSDVCSPLHGGQKLVFPCTINGEKYVAKFIRIQPAKDDLDLTQEEIILDEARLRCEREVDIIASSNCPYLAKLGPIGLTLINYGHQHLLYFTEEYYSYSLDNEIKSEKPTAIENIVRLGRNINQAISYLWGHSKVHRDIKPGNIMLRHTTGEYVLLDMGMVLDLGGASYTKPLMIAGTPAYVSPQQLDITKKRELDFRSDLFCLGIVLYHVLTKRHPFKTNACMTKDMWLDSILNYSPPASSSIRTDIPESLDEIIMRLLAKQNHQRYRSCQQLDEALARAL